MVLAPGLEPGSCTGPVLPVYKAVALPLSYARSLLFSFSKMAAPAGVEPAKGRLEDDRRSNRRGLDGAWGHFRGGDLWFFRPAL